MCSGSFHGICFNTPPTPRLLLCYYGGWGGTQCHRQRQFCYRTSQTARLFCSDSDELSCRAMRVFQTPNGGNGQEGGASQKIRASGSPSQMTHSLLKSQGGGMSLQRLSGSPAQKRMKGINEVASENALPPATSLKAHLHLFHPHTELNWASRGLNTTYITRLCPSGNTCRYNASVNTNLNYSNESYPKE